MVAQQRAPPNPATPLLSVAEEGAKNKGSQALQAGDTLPPTQGEEVGLVPSSSSAAQAQSSPDAVSRSKNWPIRAAYQRTAEANRNLTQPNSKRGRAARRSRRLKCR